MGRILCTGNAACTACNLIESLKPPFRPPVGTDPRYVGNLPPATVTVRARMEPLLNSQVLAYSRVLKNDTIVPNMVQPPTGSAPRPPEPYPETPTYIGAELAGVKSRIKDLQTQLDNAKADEKKVQARLVDAVNHEKYGDRIMHTCPGGARHKWLCIEWREEVTYDVYPLVTRKATYRCSCGARATID